MTQLNGKCKEKFLEWFSEPETYFYRLNNTCQNALIIEFFDSVGIYIEIRRNNNNPLNKGFHGYVIKSINGYYKCTTIPVKTRQEATIQAIKQANDIYNERN